MFAPLIRLVAIVPQVVLIPTQTSHRLSREKSALCFLSFGTSFSKCCCCSVASLRGCFFHLFFHFSCFLCLVYPCVIVLKIVSLSFSFFSSSRNSLISSSHLFLGLPTGRFVLMLVSSQGFHSAPFLDHRSSVHDAILIASLHFTFLCVSIQQVIFAFFICSSTSFVLLFM